MRVHPISLALRYLKGQKKMRAAPYYGKETFANEVAAIELLKKLTGEDFGNDAKKWGQWLQKNRWVYYNKPESKENKTE